MQNNEVIELITAYKKSIVLIVAEKIGIFECIQQDAYTLEMLANKLQVNQEKLRLLLLVLEDLGILKSSQGKWCFGDNSNLQYKQISGLKNIFQHERYILEEWMLPSIVEKSLKAKDGERQFDLVGFNEEGIQGYNEVMYSQVGMLIALALRKELRLNPVDYIVEWGKSGDIILKALKKIGLTFNGYYKVDAAAKLRNEVNCLSEFIEYNPQEESKLKGLGITIIYNMIHYQNEQQIHQMLEEIQDMGNENNIVCIVDLFIDASEKNENKIALDWITHGGVFYPKKS